MTQVRGRAALPYVAAIDGLRALAVLAVVAYHASVAGVPGGFFGVDVFFVISGYLVTVLFLARAHTQVGGVPIPDGVETQEFWYRRARRLVPAAAAAVVLTWLIYAALGVRSLGDLSAEALAALGYVGNWFFLVRDQSYFETITSPSPFLHFWSLAVEAQFYIVWPLLLIGALKFGGRLAAFALAVSLAAISTLVVAGLYSPEADPSRAYYGTDARVAGLLLGAALAIVVRPSLAARVPRGPIEFVGWGGIAALVYLVTQTSEFDPFIYRGGFFLASTATVLVMLAALHGHNTMAWTLSRPAFRWLGERSYSIYLWHWPVFVLSQPQLSSDLQSYSLLAARLGATLILAELSYRLVENSFRGRTGFRLPQLDLGTGPYLQRPWARPAGVVAVGLVAIVAAGGLPLRIGLADELAAIEQQVTASSANARVVTVATQTPAPSATVVTAAPTTSPAETSAPAAVTNEPTPPASHGPVDDPLVAVPATNEATPRPTEAPGDVAPEPTPVEEVPSSASSSSSGDVAGGITATTPSTTPDAAALGASVTIIGDSVALGALSSLQEALPGAVIDAEVGRQFWTANEVVDSLAAQGALGDVVVISLGANGTFTTSQFEALMTALGDRTVLFVNVTVPRRWEADVNDALVQQSGIYGFDIVDWHSASTGVAEYFGADGVHLTATGASTFASVIAQAVQAAIAAGA